jgi:hypothetical protein
MARAPCALTVLCGLPRGRRTHIHKMRLTAPRRDLTSCNPVLEAYLPVARAYVPSRKHLAITVP